MSRDGGQTFSTPVNLSNNAGDSFSPQIISEGNNLYVVWIDTTSGNNDIFAVSNNNGQTLSIRENISNNAAGSEIPDISSSSS